MGEESAVEIGDFGVVVPEANGTEERDDCVGSGEKREEFCGVWEGALDYLSSV